MKRFLGNKSVKDELINFDSRKITPEVRLRLRVGIRARFRVRVRTRVKVRLRVTNLPNRKPDPNPNPHQIRDSVTDILREKGNSFEHAVIYR